MTNPLTAHRTRHRAADRCTAPTVADATRRTSSLHDVDRRSGPPEGDGRRPHRTTALVVVISGLVLAGAGFSLGRFVTSPAARDAAREAPEPSVLTASVGFEVLTQEYSARADVTLSGRTEITVDTTATTERALVTRLPVAAGDVIDTGELAAEVSARPVFVLEGELPAFRNLAPGISGPDVRQLESALDRLGFAPGAVDEFYDAATASAVSSFYRSHGYEPVVTDDESAGALEQAIAQVADLTRQLREAEQQAAEAAAPPPQSEIAAADAAIVDAVAQRDEADRRIVAVQRERVVAQLALDALTANPTTDPATRSAAEATVARTFDDEASAVDARRSAEAGIAVARAARAELESDRSIDGLAIQVSLRYELDRARATADELGQRVGPMIPIGELVFVGALPQRIDTVFATIGDRVDGPILSLSNGMYEATSTLTAENASLIEVGDGARIVADGAAVGSLEGTVSEITPTTDGATVLLRFDDDVPDGLADTNVQVVFTLASSPEPGWTVPLSAVVTGRDGSSTISRIEPDGSHVDIPVELGLTDGFRVTVTPVGFRLAEGDVIAIGRST